MLCYIGKKGSRGADLVGAVEPLNHAVFDAFQHGQHAQQWLLIGVSEHWAEQIIKRPEERLSHIYILDFHFSPKNLGLKNNMEECV